MGNTLSLCVICKNEENNIKNLLESVKGDLFDEIVICDTGSTDKTVEIAKSYPKVKVVLFPWINDFSAARNHSFSHATCDYIQWTDADDIIKPVDYQKLLELKKRLHEKNMWLLKYEYAHDQFGNSICSFYRERIVKRSLNIKWEEPIHEYLPLISPFEKVDIEIHHYKMHNSSGRNITLLEEAVKKNPNNARNVYYLGKEYYDNNQVDDGFKALTRFVGMPDAWVENKYNAYMKMGNHMSDIKKLDESKNLLLAAVRELPLKADAYCKLGDLCHYGTQNNVEAIHWYKIAAGMERPQDVLDIVEPKYFTWLPNLQLCVCYNAIGNVYLAAVHNEKAGEYLPQDTRIQNNKKIFQNALKDKYPSKNQPVPQEKPVEKKEIKEELTFPKVTSKIGWLVPNLLNAGTIRIRTLNIQSYLKQAGYSSELCNYGNAMDYDIVVMGKTYSNQDKDTLRKLKDAGKYVIADLSENIIGWNGVDDILSNVDLVVCCSYDLKEKVLKLNKNVTVIEDSVEVSAT